MFGAGRRAGNSDRKQQDDLGPSCSHIACATSLRSKGPCWDITRQRSNDLALQPGDGSRRERLRCGPTSRPRIPSPQPACRLHVASLRRSCQQVCVTTVSYKFRNDANKNEVMNVSNSFGRSLPTCSGYLRSAPVRQSLRSRLSVLTVLRQ